MRLVKVSLIAAMMAAGFTAAARAEAPAAQVSTPAQITVTGEGQVQRSPDIATLSLGVTTQGKTAAEAMTANNAALAAVMERLTKAGISGRDLQTTNLSLNPNWSQSSSQPNAAAEISSYTASNQLTVTIRKLDTLGQVLDAAITDGANTLNGLSFGLAEAKPVIDEARKAAVADAQARAALLVEAAGAKLGRIVSISESQNYGGPMPMFRQAADAVGSVPLAGGDVATTANVTVVYEISQ